MWVSSYGILEPFTPYKHFKVHQLYGLHPLVFNNAVQFLLEFKQDRHFDNISYFQFLCQIFIVLSLNNHVFVIVFDKLGHVWSFVAFKFSVGELLKIDSVDVEFKA